MVPVKMTVLRLVYSWITGASVIHISLSTSIEKIQTSLNHSCFSSKC